MNTDGIEGTNRIEKRVFLRAPRARIWRAVADSTEFGRWFGMRFDRPFAPGARMRGVIVPTIADPEVAKTQKEYEGTPFEITVEKMEPERVFSFRWHPGAVDPGVDYATEPTTLVEFVLDDAAGGIMLTITESGFDRIPVARRAKAFEGNARGWSAQVKLIEAYLAQSR